MIWGFLEVCAVPRSTGWIVTTQGYKTDTFSRLGYIFKISLGVVGESLFASCHLVSGWQLSVKKYVPHGYDENTS